MARLEGPEVDIACGAKEPDVDRWEEGELYPTWEQLVLLAELTGHLVLRAPGHLSWADDPEGTRSMLGPGRTLASSAYGVGDTGFGSQSTAVGGGESLRHWPTATV
jgi:hypothetical protein